MYFFVNKQVLMVSNLLVLLFLSLNGLMLNAQSVVPFGYTLYSISTANSPIGMAFDSNGELLVANVQSPPRSITRFVLNNGLYSSDSVVISFNGNDHRPEFIALDNVNNVYFARPDQSDGNLYRLTPSNTIENVYLANFGDLIDPRGLAFNSQGDLFISNHAYPNQNSYISKFSFNAFNQLVAQDLSFISSLSTRVQDLVFAPNGDLFIAAGSSIIRVQFDGTGNVQSLNQNFISFPSTQTTRMVGIASDADGDLFVSQINTAFSDSGKIFMFDTLGNYSLFGTGFNQPRKLLFDTDNRMYIADYAENMIYMVECDSLNRAQDDRFCDQPLSMAELDALNNNIGVYPNPSSGQFEIMLDQTSQVDRLLISNPLGELVRDVRLLDFESLSIDLTDQSSGVYFISAMSSGTVVSHTKIALQ